MKKIFRKNQLVITALALMIAVAGYFSYMNILMESDIFTDEGTGEEVATVDGTEVADGTTGTGDAAVADGTGVTASASTDDVAVATDATGATDVENPGEAVLTSTSVANLDYAAEMKLNREQIRSKNKEALLEIVNNTSIDDALKQDAVNKMIAMTDIAEREAAAEMLLEAKGFTDVVVSITDDNCDVVLNMGEVTDAKRAQIEDIVKRKTNIAADKIVITPIVVGTVESE